MHAKSIKDELLYLDYLLLVEGAPLTLGMDEICGAHISTWRIPGVGTIPRSRTEK
jgi:hypothetical protein